MSDEVSQLELGANDYITKPLAFEELLARVRVPLRPAGQPTVHALGAGGRRLDLLTKVAWRAGRRIDLSPREWAILNSVPATQPRRPRAAAGRVLRALRVGVPLPDDVKAAARDGELPDHFERELMSGGEGVALYVCAYVPAGISEDRWAQVRELVVDQVLRLNVGLQTMRRCVRALAYLASWCLDQHVPVDVEHVLDPDTVERYCAEGLSGTEAAVSRVRGDLRRLGRTLTATAPWEPLPVPLARTKLSPPYSRAELLVIERDIVRQATPLRRTTAQAMWLLGLGAGLDGRWNTKVKGTAVSRVGDVVVVAVPDPVARLVVVRAAYATALLELAAEVGEGLLVGARKVSKNSPSELAAGITIDGGRLEFSPARLRSTWLVAHLEAGTQLPVLLRAAGMRTFGSLGDLLGSVRPLADDKARAQLAGA